MRWLRRRRYKFCNIISDFDFSSNGSEPIHFLLTERQFHLDLILTTNRENFVKLQHSSALVWLIGSSVTSPYPARCQISISIILLQQPGETEKITLIRPILPCSVTRVWIFSGHCSRFFDKIYSVTDVDSTMHFVPK